MFEIGGRAGKQGIVYEDRCLSRFLMRLVSEELTTIVVEPKGENTDICEFYTVDKAGKKIYYQCKGSNGANDHWTPSDLNRYNLFVRVRELLISDALSHFCFISPLSYRGLDDLCNRARHCNSSDDFIQNELTNSVLRSTFASCEKYFNLNC